MSGRSWLFQVGARRRILELELQPYMPTSFKEPKSSILDAAFSVDDDGVAKTQELFGEMKQPLHKLSVHPSLSLVVHYFKIKIVI